MTQIKGKFRRIFAAEKYIHYADQTIPFLRVQGISIFKHHICVWRQTSFVTVLGCRTHRKIGYKNIIFFNLSEDGVQNLGRSWLPLGIRIDFYTLIDA